jgi:hypothetical protein
MGCWEWLLSKFKFRGGGKHLNDGTDESKADESLLRPLNLTKRSSRKEQRNPMNPPRSFIRPTPVVSTFPTEDSPTVRSSNTDRQLEGETLEVSSSAPVADEPFSLERNQLIITALHSLSNCLEVAKAATDGVPGAKLALSIIKTPVDIGKVNSRLITPNVCTVRGTK